VKCPPTLPHGKTGIAKRNRAAARQISELFLGTTVLSVDPQGAKAMPVKNVQDLLLNELRDLYDAEKQLVKALPKVAKAASSEQLRQAVEEHLEETKVQVERLEDAFERLDTAARGKRCEAMRGLVEEANEMMEEIRTPQVLDAALIAGAQKVEHYEIAAYGSARALAEACGHQEVAQLLDKTLEEEKAADQKLNEIALSEVNRSALEAAA
jgi:ferritin-like metal-binding protein YciE